MGLRRSALKFREPAIAQQLPTILLLPTRLMSSVLDWVTKNGTDYGFDLTKILARGISTGGYYAMRVAHTHADRLFAAVAQGGEAAITCLMPLGFAPRIKWNNPFALAEALAYKFGYRGEDAVEAYVDDGGKFSLLDSGVLGSTELQTSRDQTAWRIPSFRSKIA